MKIKFKRYDASEMKLGPIVEVYDGNKRIGTIRTGFHYPETWGYEPVDSSFSLRGYNRVGVQRLVIEYYK